MVVMVVMWFPPWEARSLKTLFVDAQCHVDLVDNRSLKRRVLHFNENCLVVGNLFVTHRYMVITVALPTCARAQVCPVRAQVWHEVFTQ